MPSVAHFDGASVGLSFDSDADVDAKCAVHTSLVDLIKRPRIIEATVPDLIHHPHCLHIILTRRPIRHTDRRSSPHTLLQLLRDAKLRSSKELPPKPTLPAQCARPNLHTRGMSQVQGIDLEPHVIVRMHHLVRQRIFQVSAIAELVCAKKYSVLGGEAA